MATLSKELDLRPDQFAFYFRGTSGVDARELGTFLQRAATVARREGAELRVTGIRPGSVVVVLQAIKATSAAAKKEFKESPIRSTGAATTVVAAVVAAVVWAMSPSNGATPLGKAGADVIEQQNVERIEVITIEQTIIVMDEERAHKIREIQKRSAEVSPEPPRLTPPAQVRELVDAARHGMLSGGVVEIYGQLHFRPDGHTFFVPVELRLADPNDEIYSDAHYRVRADLVTFRGQPNRIVIYGAERV